MSNLENEILQGLNEALAYAKGTKIGTTHRVTLPEPVDVSAVRKKQRLSQIQFCRRYKIPLTTLRNWEQGRRTPDISARLLLRIIDREPDAVMRAIHGRAAVGM